MREFTLKMREYLFTSQFEVKHHGARESSKSIKYLLIHILSMIKYHLNIRFSIMSYLSILTNEYIEIIQLSLYVSVFATVLAFLFSLLLSSYLLLNNFRGKGFILRIVNSLMFPPVVVGLFLYIIFSNSGVLGFLDILYSPTIMIIAQFIIITPIITSLLYTIFENKFHEISEYMSSLNAPRGKIINTIILETRA